MARPEPGFPFCSIREAPRCGQQASVRKRLRNRREWRKSCLLEPPVARPDGVLRESQGLTPMAWHALRWALLVAALAPFAYYLIVIFCTWDYFRKAKHNSRSFSDFAPPVSVLKPVRGVDRDAYENFASFCRQNYPSYEVLFAVADQDDPVIPVIRKLQSDFPQVPVRLIVGVEQLGANRKLNNLARLAKEAAHEILVINDSDVRVDHDYLQLVAGHFG